ncbi:hypothetical protein CANARDRAFT_190154, partial [[Candida] arabinofermentans NRRL YB-2248]
LDFPQDLLQFYVDLSDETGTEFPTSLFLSRFPFTEFQTFASALPWYTSLLKEAQASTFYLPSDFVTEAVDEEIASTSETEPTTSKTSSIPIST